MTEIKLPIGTVTGPTPPAPEAPPQPILGKFKTTDELARAYQELERKLGVAATPTTPPAQTPATPPAGETPPAPAGGLLSEAELQTFQTEFTAQGDLSPASRAALEKKGLPKAMVDQYLNGLRATAEGVKGRVLSIVGGEEAYKAVAEWAATNVPPAELERFNATMRTGDENAITFALRGMKALYDRANDNGTRPPGRRIMGGSATPGLTPFRSNAEVQQAMRDPRFKEDPAYRQDVFDRVAASGDLK